MWLMKRLEILKPRCKKPETSTVTCGCVGKDTELEAKAMSRDGLKSSQDGAADHLSVLISCEVFLVTSQRWQKVKETPTSV